MAARIALVHHWLVEQRGGERVLERLAELLPGADLFTLLHDPKRARLPASLGAVHCSALQHVPGARRFFRALLPWLPAFYARFNLRAYSFVLSSDASVAKCVRVPPGVPHLCYCYSPPRYAHDLRELYLSQSVPRALRPLARWLLRRVAQRDRLAAQAVTEFVAISEHVAKRLRSAYARDAVVIPPPVDTEFFTPSEQATDAESNSADGAYLLAGHAVAYKRFEVALDACRELDRPLIVAGGGPRFEALRARAGARTRFVPAPSDEQLRELYRNCRALLFPGEEDFGLVPVEAMACGSPVIAWGRGGAVESVRHTETGWLYQLPASESRDEHSTHVNALRHAITDFEAIEHTLDAQVAVRQAARFSVSAFHSALAERITALSSST